VFVIVLNISFPILTPDLNKFLLPSKGLVIYNSFIEEAMDMETSIIAPRSPINISQTTILLKLSFT